MNEMEYVTREEYDATREMAQNAREENIELRKRIEQLEKSINKKSVKKPKTE